MSEPRKPYFPELEQDAVIVSAVRTATGKAYKGSLAQVRAEDLGRIALQGALAKVPQLSPEQIDDVMIGCAMPEGEQGLNVARIIAMYAGLPSEVPAATINRFCASGLQSIAFAAERIRLGEEEIIAAGGVESMSHVPMTGFHFSPNPDIVDQFPELYMSMGHTAEEVAKRYGVTREDQDAFAAASHQKATLAIATKAFQAEIVPVPIFKNSCLSSDEHCILFEQDEGVRPATTTQTLSSLKPAFMLGGTVTAGNASQMSDGAAMTIMMSRKKAKELGIKPLAVFRGFAVAGVDPEIMGIGPIKAIPKLYKKMGITQNQIDLFEINEAFAAQCVPIIRELQIPSEKLNVNGGAIALGHPLGCTGTKLSVSLIHELAKRGGGLGVVSMCVGGGMGAAGLFEVYSGQSIS